MANLTESPIYEPGIFQLEKTTPPLGGAPAFSGSNPSAGHANVQGLQLANRTAYLKQMLDTGGGQLSLDLANNTDPAKGAAKVGWDGGTIADVLAYSKAVSNYAALRSYTGVATTVRVLARNIEGLFYYDPADTTSTDNGGVTIVGSDGRRWKRYYNGPVSIRWFGATGDGTTDDYPAIQLAFTWAQAYVVGKSSGVHIHFPFGEYRMSQKATCNIAATGTPSTGMVSLHITGDGDTATTIIAMPTNTTGCFRLTSDRNTECFRVAEIGFLSDLAEDAATNNGIALQIDSTLNKGDPGYGDMPRWSVQVENLFFGGYGKAAGDLARRGNWSKGIFLQNKWYPRVQNVRCLGRYSANIGARTACDYAIHMLGCYSPDLSDIYTHGNWDKGVWLEDNYNVSGGVEDFRMNNIFCVGQNYGFGMVHEYDTVDTGRLYEPGGAINVIHVNCYKAGITIKNHRQVQIDNLYGYAPNADRAQGELLPAVVLLDGAADIRLVGQFLEPGFYTSNANASVAVRIEGGSESITVDAQFGHGGIGLLNNSTYTTRKSIFLESKMPTSRRTGAWATLVEYVDNAQTLTAVSESFGSSQDRQTISSGKPNASTYSVAQRLLSDVVGQLFGGAFEIAGKNSAGTVVNQTILRGRFVDAAGTTAGSENTALGAFIMSRGNTQEAFRLQPPSADNDTYGYLLVRIAGSPVMKRVKVGAADSGGTGCRALIVDN